MWVQDDGTRWNIMANRFDGSSWGTAELIETDNAGNVSGPQIAFDASGNAHAVWAQHDGTRNNIWANRFDGSSWGTAELIETDNASNSSVPQIAVDASGDALAVWVQFEDGRRNIWANHFDGISWDTAELIETDDVYNAYVPQIAFDASGHALAVWQQSDGGIISGIWSNRFDGSSWGIAEPVENNNVVDIFTPRIAVDASGNALVVWQQFDGTRRDLWSNHFDGNSWGTPELIETDNTGDAWNPRVAYDSSGNALAVWFQPDGTYENIWANRFDGSSWGTAELIETSNAGDAYDPQIAIDASGKAIAVWYQSVGTSVNIYSNRFE
ncbi:MAG: hypothetical protein KUG72_00130 [Pseudomonadales bacterium]|nr:hypothetical protein [Pseudomonadales bacterium]